MTAPSLLACMDAIAVHAAASFAAALGSGVSDYDVAVGTSAAKGHSVRIYYGGQVDSRYFGAGSLNSQHVAELVRVEANWPAPETAVKRQRAIEGEIIAFAQDLRVRINADYTLGGNCTALEVEPVAPVEGVVVADRKYHRYSAQIAIDLGDYSYAP